MRDEEETKPFVVNPIRPRSGSDFGQVGAVD